jgi:hypothetical protein
MERSVAIGLVCLANLLIKMAKIVENLTIRVEQDQHIENRSIHHIKL